MSATSPASSADSIDEPNTSTPSTTDIITEPLQKHLMCVEPELYVQFDDGGWLDKLQNGDFSGEAGFNSQPSLKRLYLHAVNANDRRHCSMSCTCRSEPVEERLLVNDSGITKTRFAEEVACLWVLARNWTPRGKLSALI